MFENFQFKWRKKDILILQDFYITYKLSIEEISHIINRTEYDIKNKLIELKIVDPINPLFIQTNSDTDTDTIDRINHLCRIDNDIRLRIKLLESKKK